MPVVTKLTPLSDPGHGEGWSGGTLHPADPGTRFPRRAETPETAVAGTSLHHLKVYSEEAPEVVRPEIEDVGSLPGILDAFRRATGWSLEYLADPRAETPADLKWSAPVNPGVGVPLGHLRLGLADAGPAGGRPVDADTARHLATAVAGMLGELLRTQHVLWRREAELAKRGR